MKRRWEPIPAKKDMLMADSKINTRTTVFRLTLLESNRTFLQA
jgi:hypothetical protein